MPTKPVFDPSSSKMKYACGFPALAPTTTGYMKETLKKSILSSVMCLDVRECKGMELYGAQAVSLDSTIYFREMWGLGKAPRHGGLKEIVTIWPL